MAPKKTKKKHCLLSNHLSDPGRCEMELLHLRAGTMRAAVMGWLRRPFRVRRFRDILASLVINIVDLICFNERKVRDWVFEC